MNRWKALVVAGALCAAPLSAMAQDTDDAQGPSITTDYNGDLHVAITLPLVNVIMMTTQSSSGMWGRVDYIVVPKQFLGSSFIKTIKSNSTIVADDKGLHVFLIGGDQQVIHRFKPYNQPWQDWESLYGKLTSAPRATIVSGKIYVVARGTDKALWYTSGTTGQWADWQPLPGGSNMAGAPVVAGVDGGFVVIGKPASQPDLWGTRFQNGQFRAWKSLGAQMYTTPTSYSDGRYNVSLAARNADNTINIVNVDADLNVYSNFKVQSTAKQIPAIGYTRGNKVIVTTGGDDKTWIQSESSGNWYGGWTQVRFDAHYIQDFKLSSGKSPSPDCPTGYEADASQDLNQGAGGNYIFLCTKYTTDPDQAVRGVSVTITDNPYSAGSQSRRCGFDASGEKGKPVTDKNGSIIDLNAGAGGAFIYLCQGVPAVGGVSFGGPYGPYSSYRWHVWHRLPLSGICDFGDGSQLVRGDVINKAGENVRDLNAGAGGAYVYLCLTNAK